ncbi:hypothetical protein FEM48_Zijuj12G0196100 [Ziziphus jujuba var. spinosa]|uniref:Uncharacterized protein n=1 Tax=Ziziphus jujuba var. spinosa TaxID=714518 RepID=A0A978UF58_ZIZJJ|nr:hypothetical protein FEM48_Zijuj12G0196100 [Ziziphus jujuba var. spinosa]
MNSNRGKNFDFDLGIGSSQPKSLNEQKNRTSSYSSYSSSSSSSSSSSFSSSYSSTQTRPAWQPNKPSWTHQPAPNLASGPTSMVGDIFGKTWSSTPSGSSTGIGITNKNPNLFGDLVGSAMGGHGKSNANVPLKNATPISMASSGAATNKSSFSMGNMADSLPKTSAHSTNTGGTWGSSGGFNNISTNNNNYNKNSNLGGPSMKSMGSSGGGGGIGIGSKKDPFGSFVDFGSKQSSSLNSGTKSDKVGSTGGDAFGDFQNASKSSSNSNFAHSSNSAKNDNFMGSNSGSGLNMNDFGMPKNQTPPAQSSSADPFGMFFSASTPSAGGAAAATTNNGVGGQQTSEVDDWGLDSEFGGGSDVGGSTIELEGLPPPPAGVSASVAKNKGMDNYKQGQYADAIKWLSWAVILLEKAGDHATNVEVLSSRASCYKEVGEYKKAVADCTKVLEQDDANVAVLVQRALLYESMEKYRLGAEDLRTVLKVDPLNRIARSTIHRLNKLAD